MGKVIGRTVAAPKSVSEAAADTPRRLTMPAQLIGAVLLGLSAFWPEMPVESVRETLLWVGGLLFGAATGTRAVAETQIQGELVRAESARRLSHAAMADARGQAVAANLAAIAPKRRDGR